MCVIYTNLFIVLLHAGFERRALVGGQVLGVLHVSRHSGHVVVQQLLPRVIQAVCQLSQVLQLLYGILLLLYPQPENV